jgi:hypothetical protein
MIPGSSPRLGVAPSQNPGVLRALDPTHALRFATQHGFASLSC